MERCVYRKAGLVDIDLILTLRMEFVRDIHPEFTPEVFADIAAGTETYLQHRLRDKTYIGFFGETESGIATAAGILLYSLPPLYSGSQRTIGHVLSVFTRPQFRGNGFAKGLIEYIKQTASQNGISQLLLNATPDGYALYKNCGFYEPFNTAMALDVSFTNTK